MPCDRKAALGRREGKWHRLQGKQFQDTFWQSLGHFNFLPGSLQHCFRLRSQRRTDEIGFEQYLTFKHRHR
ncbi:hypothetical protein D3C72_649780 [compost metagenome]